VVMVEKVVVMNCHVQQKVKVGKTVCVTDYATYHRAVRLKKRTSQYTVRIIIFDLFFGLRATQSFGRAIRPAGFHCICDYI